MSLPLRVELSFALFHVLCSCCNPTQREIGRRPAAAPTHKRRRRPTMARPRGWRPCPGWLTGPARRGFRRLKTMTKRNLGRDISSRKQNICPNNIVQNVYHLFYTISPMHSKQMISTTCSDLQLEEYKSSRRQVKGMAFNSMLFFRLELIAANFKLKRWCVEVFGKEATSYLIKRLAFGICAMHGYLREAQLSMKVSRKGPMRKCALTL